MNTVTTPHHLTTEQFAELLHGSPSTIRRRLCTTGSFYGIRPVKLPSGRLLWPAGAISEFIGGKGACND